ncbi:hypothetical protein BEH94_00585 [Candidatus Altiarchaeales archaeon WOR_SM1_SCG]|nr:hypothetical protein BEH94_00585 [Candidatus Altiarchaeales archaeon WOR_SM1_SCG]
MYDDKYLKDYVQKTTRNFLNNKEIMNSLRMDAEKRDEDELEIVSQEKEPGDAEVKRILVPLAEDIYYMLSAYHLGEKLTPAEEDIIKSHPLKDRKEYIEKFKKYLPGVADENIPGVVMWVMKNYLEFMADLERTSMQVIFAERIGALAEIKKKKQLLPPHPSPELRDFWTEYRKGKFTKSRVKREVKEHLDFMIESAEMDFERERKDFYEVIKKSFSEISNIGNNKNIQEALLGNVRKFMETEKQEFSPQAGYSEKITDERIEKLIEKREFHFMPVILEIIIKSENLAGDFEIAPLIEKLKIAVFNLNIAAQMGVEDAMNAYKHNVLIYFYRKAGGKFGGKNNFN